MPSISFLLVALLNRHVPAAAQLFRTDPMLLYVLLLETCMPSAQNLTVILQLQGKKKAATRLARVLMIIYFFGVPAITYWLVRILHLTKLF
jgi:predicted permease